MRKITLVGAGRVGESTAQILAREELARELVLIDINGDAARGIALDIQESAPLFGFDTRLRGGDEHELLEGSDLVVISAGRPRKPGMSRADLREANLAVVLPIVDSIREHAPDAMILMVTNPVDVLTYAAWKRTGWPRQRVFGLSGVLDSTRMASFLAKETGFSVKDIRALVIGGHGDAMVPLARFSTINGIPVTHFLDEETLGRINEKTRQGGAEILALKQTSSAYDAPAASIAAMVDAIARSRRRILPCVAVLDGEYGQHDIAMGVPVVLGPGGMEQVVELPLTEREQEALERSAEGLRKLIDEGALT
ncbi:MAG: malate dehydrogenase [Gammaproteobacteria bacterium]|nr:MAG: malate dehydrogenase [Gammaproteobacteria bacterium]